MPFIIAAGHRLEYQAINPHHAAAPWLVFLHEGLGSVAMWKAFPLRLCVATGCRGLVYSRFGYGKSDPLAAPRRVDFMHDEALHALPQLLDQLHVANPVLFGHSDGGSIALLHAELTTRPVAALVVMAAHVLVEDVSVTSIAAAKLAWEGTHLRDKLCRYHDHPDSAFLGWNDIWLLPIFAHGISKPAWPGFNARCWRSRASTMSTQRWSSSPGSCGAR